MTRQNSAIKEVRANRDKSNLITKGVYLYPKPCYTFNMKKQKGFGLIFLIISIAILAFTISVYFSIEAVDEKTGESKTIFEQQTDAIQQAKDLKEILEEKSKIEIE